MTMTVQPRHAKLGLAAREGNGPYAAYEQHQLEEAFERTAKIWPKWRTYSISEMMTSVTKEPIKALDEAIKAGDPSRFAAAYEQLTAACTPAIAAPSAG